jgi:hypothetical protein
MKLFFNQLDIWLGRLVTSLMLPLLYLCFFTLSLLMFYVIGISAFEYEISLLDIDRLEVLFLSLLLLTSYRLFYRGRQQYWSYWRLLKRFFFVTGVVALFDIFAFDLLISASLLEKSNVLANILHPYQDIHLFSLGSLLVFALYAAAPLPPLFKDKQAGNDEPTTADNANRSDIADKSDDTIVGRGEGFTFRDVNKQSHERVEPWFDESFNKDNHHSGKGV